MVKLNNPLTGTEINVLQGYHSPPPLQMVKLNNPLMGTETLRLQH